MESRKKHFVLGIPHGNPKVESQFTALNKHVDLTDIDGFAQVSTVLLPFPHLGGEYETMIFGAGMNSPLWRYRTFEDAKKGHDRVVNWLRHENADLELAIKKLLNEQTHDS